MRIHLNCGCPCPFSYRFVFSRRCRSARFGSSSPRIASAVSEMRVNGHPRTRARTWAHRSTTAASSSAWNAICRLRYVARLNSLSRVWRLSTMGRSVRSPRGTAPGCRSPSPGRHRGDREPLRVDSRSHPALPVPDHDSEPLVAFRPHPEQDPFRHLGAVAAAAEPGEQPVVELPSHALVAGFGA